MGGENTGWRLAAPALGWLAGSVVQLNERALMPTAWYAACIGAGLLAVAMGWRWRRAYGLAVLGLAAIAFGSTGWRAAERLSQALPAALEGQDLQVTGVVAGLPQHGASGLRFRFDVEQATWRGEAVSLPTRLSVGWYIGFHEDAALSQPQQALRAGQRWRFMLRLRQPHGQLNPHGFDYELQLFEQGVRAVGYVRDAPALLLDPAAGHWVERARQRLRDAIDAAVADRRAAGVIAALSVGDQSAIDRDDWELFRNTGVAHLVSISGLHITMLAWLAGAAIGALWRRSASALLWRPAPVAARWGGMAIALAYAVFSGWGVPAQRTVWMLAAVTLLQASGRRWPWPLVLLTAAVVVTVIDPWALLQPGFWLSFVAVGVLMASDLAHRPVTDDTPPARGWRAMWAQGRGALRSQVVATVGLTPLTLVFFQQVSMVGFIANLVAIPLVTLVITPLALLGALASPLWALAAWGVQRLADGLAWLATLPGAVWTAPAAPVWAQACGLAAAVLLVLPLPWRLRALSIALVLPLLMPPVDRPAEGRFELLAVDVGQGTAVLVRTRHHLLLYDAGPQYSRDSDAGQRVLLPLLRSLGEARIDRLVLSHRDTDHVGGARALLERMAVHEVSSSLEEGHPLLALPALHTRCEGGQSWQWDGVRFEVLQPAALAYGAGLKSNAMSCVLKVEDAASHSALLAGDIERDQEAWLVARDAAALKSDVLLVPHHGSRTSSTERFLDAVQPRAAVLQAGYRNRFGHPADDVVARYRTRGVAVFDSVSCGAWRWQAGAARGVCQRDVARRYWHHAPQTAAP